MLPPDLRERFDRVEVQCRKELEESLAVKGRATDWIRTGSFDRSFKHLEHAALVRYHCGKLAKKVRWIQEGWKDTLEE